MSEDFGLQSKKWDGYFDESKDSIMGWYKRCMICNRIPSEIWHDGDKLFSIWHCRTCKVEDYKPKNWFQRLLIRIDKQIEL